jgi:predicted nucleic acid-binding protein
MIIKSKTVQFRRQYGLKLPDCIIAATACYLGIPIFSSSKERLPDVENVKVSSLTRLYG